MSMPSDTDRACSEIVRNLLALDDPTWRDARRTINSVCSELSLDRMPGKDEILAATNSEGYARLKGVLLKRPAKTGSGVAVVALMPMPYACPHGRCTYCPGGIPNNTPNSYVGTEPLAVGAIKNGYDPYLQITSKIDHLIAYGHNPTKMELVVVGGTFLFMPHDYREAFVKSCYDALNGRISGSLEAAKHLNERARIRNVGFTIETKPDYCKKDHVDAMLEYGVTRVEIGVQSLQEKVYGLVNRGHTLRDVLESFQTARDAGLKIVAHMMPGLPTATPEKDKADFDRLFQDASLRPDMLKVYPSLVLRDTPLYDQYTAGSYTPYTQDEVIDILADIKATIPEWVRIMRVQREIAPRDIVAGPRQGNLRQLVHMEMERRGTRCRCIRCREPRGVGPGEVSYRRIDYDASGGVEVFLSYVDAHDRIHGFLRLRKPSPDAHRPEAKDSALVRELHVYGRALGMGERGGIQHLGLGKRLLAEAERISCEEFGRDRILVISAVGTREYYSKNGYSLYGPYMVKRL